jgi:hypothetical protein
MYLVIVTLVFYMLGGVFVMLPMLLPDPRMALFTYLGMFILCLPNIMVWQRIISSQTYLDVDKLPKWKHLIHYLRRDNHIVPILGTRAYSGESFLDVPKLGLIEFLGKDCYYSYGDKKILFGLENINYSPDIKYSNLCSTLWKLGFRNSEDLKKVLEGDDLLMMGKVYQNMLTYDDGHGACKLVEDMRIYNGKPVVFKPASDRPSTDGIIKDDIGNAIDKLLRRKHEEEDTVGSGNIY